MLSRLIRDKKGPEIIICCGSGGVGKTTVSAAVAVMGALSGKKTIVLTIDPARRLADALGLKHFSRDVQPVPLKGLSDTRQSLKAGLFAMMLDPKRTFDELIFRHAPAQMGKTILNNRYYQYLSNNMAGSHEYMAMEALYDIHRRGGYDLIVLDTPPSRRALDFLDAPQRLLNILGHHFFMNLFKPYLQAGKWGGRLLNIVASPVLRGVGKIVGQAALTDFAEFMKLWDDALFEGFGRRAKAVKALLSSPQSLFLAVATPQRMPLREALYLYERLREHNMPFGGFVINRIEMPDPAQKAEVSGGGPPENGGMPERALDTIQMPAALKQKILKAHERMGYLAAQEASAIASLAQQAGVGINIYRVPWSESEVASVSDLERMGKWLQ